jgi:hypothetical protein
MYPFKKLKYLILVILTTIFSLQESSAQEKSSNNDVWFHYFGKNMLSEKFSFSFEATM